MVFNAMVTNNDDHPRNHALLQTRGGWRRSPAYDILPVPMVSVERRDLALQVGRFGRAASLYNILSHYEAFGLSKEEARALIDGMLNVVRGWREFFVQRGVEQRSVEMLEQAILPLLVAARKRGYLPRSCDRTSAVEVLHQNGGSGSRWSRGSCRGSWLEA